MGEDVWYEGKIGNGDKIPQKKKPSVMEDF